MGNCHCCNNRSSTNRENQNEVTMRIENNKNIRQANAFKMQSSSYLGVTAADDARTLEHKVMM